MKPTMLTTIVTDTDLLSRVKLPNRDINFSQSASSIWADDVPIEYEKPIANGFGRWTRRERGKRGIGAFLLLSWFDSAKLS